MSFGKERIMIHTDNPMAVMRHMQRLYDTRLYSLMEDRVYYHLYTSRPWSTEPWSVDHQRTFILSILRNMPIGPMVLRQMNHEDSDVRIEYAVVDGRQRLQAIFDFMDNKLVLDGQPVSAMAGDPGAGVFPDEVDYDTLYHHYQALYLQFVNHSIEQVAFDQDVDWPIIEQIRDYCHW